MAYTSYNNLWESEIADKLSRKNKVQDMNINQLKLEVQDTFKKDGNLTTNFEALND